MAEEEEDTADAFRSLKSTSMSLSDIQAGDWSALLMRLRSFPAPDDSIRDCLSASYAKLSVVVNTQSGLYYHYRSYHQFNNYLLPMPDDAMPADRGLNEVGDTL